MQELCEKRKVPLPEALPVDFKASSVGLLQVTIRVWDMSKIEGGWRVSFILIDLWGYRYAREWTSTNISKRQSWQEFAQTLKLIKHV